MIQPPEGYELWSPKRGDKYPQVYMYRSEFGASWKPGSYPGEEVGWFPNSRYFCRPKPKPEIKADPNPPQLTMDKAFITQRPQWSALLDLSLIAHEIGNQINALADQDNSGDDYGMALVHAEALDQLIDLLRETADAILFTDHKEAPDAK